MWITFAGNRQIKLINLEVDEPREPRGVYHMGVVPVVSITREQ